MNAAKRQIVIAASVSPYSVSSDLPIHFFRLLGFVNPYTPHLRIANPQVGNLQSILLLFLLEYVSVLTLQRERGIPAACHILPACVGQCLVHGVHRFCPAVFHFRGFALACLVFADAAALIVIPVAGGEDAGTIVVFVIPSHYAACGS